MTRKDRSYLVLGMGVGKSVAKCLADRPSTKKVVIIDRDKRLSELGPLFAGPNESKVRYVVADIGTLDLVTLFKHFCVVISALPAPESLVLAEAAFRAGTHFLDLGGVVEVTKKLMTLNRYWGHGRTSVVLDTGFMPGAGNVMVKKMAADLDFHAPKRAIIYVGGIPQNPRPPVFHQNMFYLGGLESICYDKIPVLEKGHIVLKEPFSGYERIIVPELIPFSQFKGELEAFDTAGSSIAPWEFKRDGFTEFREKTVRWPGFADFVRGIPREKFKETIWPHINIRVDAENPDIAWMRVEVSGLKNGRKVKKVMTLLDFFDPVTGLTAMQRVTGFSAAITAEMVADGMAKGGVHTPESAFDMAALGYFLDSMREIFDMKEDMVVTA